MLAMVFCIVNQVTEYSVMLAMVFCIVNQWRFKFLKMTVLITNLLFYHIQFQRINNSVEMEKILLLFRNYYRVSSKKQLRNFCCGKAWCPMRKCGTNQLSHDFTSTRCSTLLDILEHNVIDIQIVIDITDMSS